jgi:hypothetical protein
MEAQFRAWGVVCEKGNSVFIDHTRAMEYADKHRGILVDLSTFYNVKAAQHNSPSVRQEGTASCEGYKLLHEDTSTTSESSSGSGNSCETNATCGNSSVGASETMEQGLSPCDNPL